MQRSTAIPIVIVAAVGKTNRVIGDKNQLLWHVPDDLKRFKRLTLGHPIILGRKTFESILNILGKPLPGRTNIVVTRNPAYKHKGVRVVTSLEEAVTIAEAEHPAEIHIGGGAELYKEVLPHVDRLHITWFYDEKDGDAFFPEFEEEFEVTGEQPVMEHDGIQFQWIDYKRKD